MIYVVFQKYLFSDLIWGDTVYVLTSLKTRSWYVNPRKQFECTFLK